MGSISMVADLSLARPLIRSAVLRSPAALACSYCTRSVSVIESDTGSGGGGGVSDIGATSGTSSSGDRADGGRRARDGRRWRRAATDL